ncbi:hypothetical protein [Tenacibaculum aquimarinum]|uniref:hypothetical protein n=1 Tax=Tenacibaculum aquimarinum TaxID=2910675 RepID=UPI001F0B6440|nr:hypothetical protein [Tenacibaculum aquimarinum]MCH3884154.1 hypothetical protein [Tenacibaculum aquimarinum]
MKKRIKLIITLFFLSIILTNCKSSTKLYKNGDKNKIKASVLNDSTYIAVKDFLAKKATQKIKDTIIIEYSYNNENCWNLLDEKRQEYIKSFILKHNLNTQLLSSTRPTISYFSYKEPGENFNKIKKWDKTIKLDSTKTLLNLLFKERAICGTSAMILPDQKVITILSDSHHEILNLNKTEVSKILIQKNKYSLYS